MLNSKYRSNYCNIYYLLFNVINHFASNEGILLYECDIQIAINNVAYREKSYSNCVLLLEGVLS